MKLKEKLKKEIDSVPEECLPQIERYLAAIKNKKKSNHKIRTLHLQGRFDEKDIRRLAYE
jgi:hypothetical protein